MITRVPYLHEAQIERDAAALLAEYEQARGVTIAPPIPIEDIVEKHLKLCLEFNDTHRLFGVRQFGANSFADARIVIDESLDPEENPAMEGRYRFTLTTGRPLRLMNLASTGHCFAYPCSLEASASSVGRRISTPLYMPHAF